MRRLLPAAVLVIVVTCVLQLLVASEPARISMVADARASLLYVANWQFIHDANDYFASGVEGSPFLHFWSLSIEEQFYVFYPLLLLVVLVRLHWSRRRLAVVLAVLMAALDRLAALRGDVGRQPGLLRDADADLSAAGRLPAGPGDLEAAGES